MQHYWEIHDGIKQEFLMRITSKHQSPLERQAQEAIQIAEFSSKNPAEYDLNRKSEFGKPRIPKITVHTPGDAEKDEEAETETAKFLRDHLRQGTTRLRYRQQKMSQAEEREEEVKQESKRARKDEAVYEYKELNRKDQEFNEGL